MVRLLRLFAALVLLAAAPAYAQVPGLSQVTGSGSAESGAGTESTPETAAPASTQSLIDLLKDDTARNALIRQLEATIAADGEATQEAAEEIRPLATSFGREIAELTQDGLARFTEVTSELAVQFRDMPRKLSSLRAAIDPSVTIQALRDLAVVIAITVAAFILLRLIARRPMRALAARAQGAGWFETAAYQIAFSLLAAAVVILAWASGYALTATFYEGFGSIQTRQSLYLNAFLSVGIAKVIGRALLSPRFRSLRLISLPDAAANSIWRWLNTEIVLLGYGIMLAVPIVSVAAGFFAGAALEMVIGIIAIVYTLVRVWRARRPVSEWLHKGAQIDGEDSAEPADTSRRPALARLAALWHWPVTLYLLALLVLVLARPGNVLMPVLKTSGQVLAMVVVGMMAIDLMTKSARRGVRLSPALKHRLPLLENRLNGLLPTVLLVLRLAVAAIVLAVSLDLIGLYDLSGSFGGERGVAMASTLISVFLILIVASVLWLALASWVEYRLNPLVGRVPSARETTLLTLLRNASAIALLILTLMITLSQIGINIAPLLASAGVLGLAIGFGAQKMVQDIITGVFIQFENAMNVGDVVSVGGIIGTVEKLTVRSVSLRDVNGVFHIIPFSSVDAVSNYMKDFSFYVSDMGVAYREDIDEVKQAMLDAFDILREDEEHSLNILGDLEWFGLNSFGDSAIVLRARIKTLPGKQWATGRAYNAVIKRIFDERGIEIPYPHQTIYFGEDRKGNAPPIHVKAEPVDAQLLPEPTGDPDPTHEQPSESREAVEPKQDGPANS